MKIEIGVFRTDVVEDAANRAPDPRIESFDAIGVDRAANVFAV